MNIDFSIESSIEKIQNTKSREYFKEVYQTFVNSNYRSATVMLYSVLICDLVYKMRDLRDVYGDTTAEKIIKDVENLQSKNPSSPEWESKLVEFIQKRTSLLEPSDIVSIESLQKFRHLSAHPVLTNSDLLYSPNKDTVQSLIRNVLDGILTKPPFFSNKIYPNFLQDLSEVKDKLTDDNDLKSYIDSRYLKQIKETDFIKIFRSHWKIVFITDDASSEENRVINYRALRLMIAHKRELCSRIIKNEASYYSNINKDVALNYVVALLARFPEFFELFDSSLQILLNGQIDKDDNLKFMAWFKNKDLKTHLEILEPKDMESIDAEYLNFIQELSIENQCLDTFNDFLVEYLAVSNHYADSSARFRRIEKIPDLSLDMIKRILEVSNKNSQIYQCAGMPGRLRRFVPEKFDEEINKEEYPNIWK